jgi:hypothetical protein
MRVYEPLFNLAASEAKKDLGRAPATTNCRDSLLAFVSDAVRKAALFRPDRVATLDDAYSLIAELGNAPGSIFSREEWGTAGWKPSQRTSNQTPMIRQWRLRR